MSQIIIDLPFPISVNAVWRNISSRTIKSKEYRLWIREAGFSWLAQKPSCAVKSIKGHYALKIILNAPDKRQRDLGNYDKALSDFLQLHQIVENDFLCRDLHIVWGGKEDAPNGARLILTKCEA